MRYFLFFFIGYLGIVLESRAFVIGAVNEQEYFEDDSASYFNNLGIEKFRAGDFEQAGHSFRKSLEIKKRDKGPLSADMASTYTNLGVVSRRLFDIQDAMQYYDTAGFIFLNHYGADHYNLGAVYHNQGNILRESRDINSALSYYKIALNIFLKNDLSEWVSTLCNNIGIAYEMQGNYDQAKEYYIRSIDIRKKTDYSSIAIPAGNLAICYKETGDLLLADHYYLMAIDAIKKSAGSDNVLYATNLLNYGLFLITNAGEHDKGYEMLSEALAIYKSFYGDKGHYIARAYMNIGYSYEVNGDLKTALRYYQKSIIANSKVFSSTDIRKNPAPDEKVFSEDYILASLKHKASAYYLISKESNEIANLEASLSAYKLAIGYIEKIRMGHYKEDSQMLHSENEHETYLHAIHVASKLHELTGETTFLYEAFIFSERSKAASLLASIRDVEAKSFGGVPENLLENEQNLKKGIAAYGELIYDEQRSVNPNTDKISLWQERVFSLELELRKLVGQLEEEYPDYYFLKYNQEVIDVKSIMKNIGPRDALISYVYSDSLVYIFTITNTNSSLNSVSLDSCPEDQLENLLDVLTSGNIDRRVREDFITFTNSSLYFYNHLIKPVISNIKDKRLIIVPDGILAYVPFELLISSVKGSVTNNYKNLPYLLRDFIVSYNYSATLWQESLQKTSKAAKMMLSMAPSYEQGELSFFGNYQNRQYYREKLTPLPGAREEALRIAEMLNGDVFLNEEASESNFKHMAGDYKLLHLAMHTILDDENPMYSKLVFAETENSEEDGLLNTFEIYNLQLNASLAVLSSCHSGYGTMRHGEGVMSLARGFLYAGVPSIVMTNWEVEDKSGAEIMIGFYKYILKGYRKDEALRMARLDFLDNTDMLRSHPYFWGAYVCIGNPDVIFKTYRQFYPLITFSLLILIMIIILWRGQLRRS